MEKCLVDKGTEKVEMTVSEVLTLINNNADKLTEGLVEDYRGFKLTVKVNSPIGNLCGYITGKPKDITDIHRDIYVHGDWTFINIDNVYHYDMPSVEEISDQYGSDTDIVIGFDCAHSGDVCLHDINMVMSNPGRKLTGSSYKDIGFVFTELKRVVDEYLGDKEE